MTARASDAATDAGTSATPPSAATDTPEVTLVGGRALLPDGALEPACVTLTNGRIAEVSASEGRPAGPRIDLGGRLLLPGIVDLHGDAFEHVLMPRSGVRFPMDLALAEIDRQLVANGITTVGSSSQRTGATPASVRRSSCGYCSTGAMRVSRKSCGNMRIMISRFSSM